MMSSPGKGWSKGKEFVARDICVICSGKFYTAPRYKRMGRGKCCSTKCAGKYRSITLYQKSEMACAHCGKKEMIRMSQVKKGRRYCSRSCVIDSKRKKHLSCTACGELILGGGKKYCSMKCYSRTGSNHPQWIEKKLSICSACGKEYRARSGDRGVVCSLRCWGKIKIAKYPQSCYSRGKGGKRPDLDGLYVRSRWEANWARYLNWLVKHKQILKWEYEADTFEFHKIKRGSRHYTPDFKIYELNGRIIYHEVKGYMDQKSKTKLDRMKRYYPEIVIVLIEQKQIREVAKKVSALIPYWELDKSKGKFG